MCYSAQVKNKNAPFFKSLKNNENLCLVYVILENCTHYRVVTWYNGGFYVAELSFKTCRLLIEMVLWLKHVIGISKLEALYISTNSIHSFGFNTKYNIFHCNVLRHLYCL